MTAYARSSIEGTVKSYALSGLRVLALAVLDVTSSKTNCRATTLLYAPISHVKN